MYVKLVIHGGHEKLTDLLDRTRRAADTCEDLAGYASTKRETNRLTAKAEGFRIAAAYISEALAELNPPVPS